MRRTVSISILLTGLALAGCNKDDIISDDPWNENTEEGGSTSGITGSTTIPVNLDEEDLIAGTTFSRTISITFSNTGDAKVTGDENGIVTVKGNQVTVDNTATSEKVRYELSGTTSNGFFKIYSKNKQALVLNNVSITNPNGAAINNQGKKRSFVVVNGKNYLADGATYTATPDDEDEKAAFFSEGQLIFSGEGSLEVTAVGKAGITSDDYLNFLDGPTLKISSTAGHGLRGKDAVYVNGGNLSVQTSAHMKKGIVSDSLVVFNGGVTTVAVTGGTDYDDEDQEYKASAGVKADQCFVMNDGTLTITNSGQGGKGISGDGVAYFQGGTVDITVTGSNYGKSSGGFGPWGGGSSSSSDNSKSAKGIKFDGDIYISGGSVSAKASNHEGIESKGQLQITGGAVFAQSKDDAINSAGVMAVTGGFVCAYSTGNDGMDANKNLYLDGGVVYAIGSGSPEVAIDANTEERYKLYVNGGTLFALGGLESGAVISQKCYSGSWTTKKWYSMTVGDNTYAFFTPTSGGNGLVVSGSSQPAVKSNVSVAGGTEIFKGMGVVDGTMSGGSNVSLSSYSGSNSGPGMGGPGW